MKKFTSTLLPLLCAFASWAQSSDFSFKFYGRVRADLFYNSRASNENVDGLFYLYPKDHDYDPDGKDMNAYVQGNMYMLYTRLGLDIAGPMIGSAKSSAKIEFDFRGSGTSYATPRIRHAYIQLDWGASALLIGQTWHPLFGEVSPSVLNLNTGAPFQPFSRTPMLRYRYTGGRGLMLTAAAIWQQQYTSPGPDGKTWNYLKNSNIPELYAGLDYKTSRFLGGIGAELLSLKPRLQATVDGLTYKVSERAASVSVEAHARYKAPNWTVSGKTVYANNLAHCSMLGGYAATDIDSHTGEMKYTPFRHSMTWLNFTYGNKWQPGIFIGYLKNLGTGKAITGTTYGTGLDVDQLFSASAQLSYNLPHWKIGAEFQPSTAWFGTLDNSDGRVRDTHSVTNYRILCVAMYIF